jgi:hypothetical protein
MMAQTDRLNFRCGPLLRKRLAEAAARSKFSISKQARVSLEKLYGAEEKENVWLPNVLRQEQPSSDRSFHGRKAVGS